jgi:hypothetical protein
MIPPMFGQSHNLQGKPLFQLDFAACLQEEGDGGSFYCLLPFNVLARLQKHYPSIYAKGTRMPQPQGL